MRESLKPGYEGDALMMKANTVKQAKELTTPFQPDTLEPSIETNLVFSVSEDATALCQKYGELFTFLPDPSKCHAIGRGLEVAVVGEKSTAVIQALSFRDEPFKKPIKSLECELASEITGIGTSCDVERRGESQYEISYRPTVKGRHQLHIKVKGQHIRGSPFSIVVTSPVENLGTPIQILRGIEGPWDIAITQKGEVVVTEEKGHRVSMFSPNGLKLRSFGSYGSDPGEFIEPCGVVVDGEGNVLVADSGNHRIQKFTGEGQFLTSVGTEGSGPLQFKIQFKMPLNITFSNDYQNIYVTDNNNHRIQILNSDLTFSGAFGKYGAKRGQFLYPHQTACDSTGKVCVADTSNNRIQVFTAKGRFLKSFGRLGRDRGGLHSPDGVAIDTSGLVYISDRKKCHISVFTLIDGDFVTTFGKEGRGPEQFAGPRGIAVDNSGVLYVCDYEANAVKMF